MAAGAPWSFLEHFGLLFRGWFVWSFLAAAGGRGRRRRALNSPIVDSLCIILFRYACFFVVNSPLSC